MRALLLQASLVLCLAGSAVATAPAWERGLPLMEVFATRDYGEHGQNWAITQDLRGRILLGNGNGVLIFDGSRWEIVPVENRSIVRSLDVAEDGRIYVGAVGEIGVLETGIQGENRYRSLNDFLPPEHAEFSNVWRTFATPEGIVFWIGEALLRWNGESFSAFEILPSKVPFTLENSLWVNDRELGLLKLTGQGLQQIPGTEALSGIGIFFALPKDDENLLVGARGQGLFLVTHPLLLEEGRDLVIEPFRHEAEALLKEHRLYSGVRLHDGTFAIGTMTGGLVVLDGEGRQEYALNRSSGLPDASIWALYRDREQGLWLGLNRGLARLETGSPVWRISERLGIDGTIESIARYEDRLWVATSLGLLRFDREGFVPIEGPRPPCWSLLALENNVGRGNQLWVGCNDGIWILEGENIRRMLDAGNAFELFAPPSGGKNDVLVGSDSGLLWMQWQGTTWKDRGAHPRISAETRNLAEVEDTLWVGTHFEGVLRLPRWRDSWSEEAELRAFGEDDGLGTALSVKVAPLGDRLLFGTSHGLFELDPVTDRFRFTEALEPEEASRSVLRLVPGSDGVLWIAHSDTADPPEGYRRVDRRFLPGFAGLASLPMNSYYAVLPEEDATWFGGPEGLFRYRREQLQRSPTPLEVHLRSLAVRGSGTPSEPLSLADRTVLPFSKNWIRAEYAAPVFDSRDRVQFRTRLAGLEKDWTPWTADSSREFSSLREGEYRLEVQARNARGRTSPTTKIEIAVEPPGYRSPAAFLAYSIAGVLVVWGSVSLRSRQLERERQELEQAVRDRTRQLRRRTTDLEATRQELEAFTYAVSHDLRAPLRRIDGFAQMLVEDFGGGLPEEARELLGRMRGNSRNLAELVDALLQLSRLSRTELQPESLDLTALAEDVIDLLESAEPERQVDVRLEPGLRATGDPRLVTVVLQNLLGNAWKFTRDRRPGRIEMGLARKDAGEPSFFVRDNGAGFEMRYADKLFAPFQRLHSQSEFPGTGIGLATVRRIVDRHGGKIRAESEVDRGTTFFFSLGRED